MNKNCGTWTKPELVVIVRGRPEESVMGGCKSGVAGGAKGADESACASSLVSQCVACDYPFDS